MLHYPLLAPGTPFYMAKSQTKTDSPIRNFARVSRVWRQGITAKPAKNYDKAHFLP
jgi:hypothetical protein